MPTSDVDLDARTSSRLPLPEGSSNIKIPHNVVLSQRFNFLMDKDFPNQVHRLLLQVQ